MAATLRAAYCQASGRGRGRKDGRGGRGRGGRSGRGRAATTTKTADDVLGGLGGGEGSRALKAVEVIPSFAAQAAGGTAREVVRLVDEEGGAPLPLECLLRRRVRVAPDREVMVVTPLDLPIDVLRGDSLGAGEGADEDELTDLDDDELESVLQPLATALARRGLLLQDCAYNLTVRGPLRFCDEDVVMLNEGEEDEMQAVEVLSFPHDGALYTAYALMAPAVLIAEPDAALETLGGPGACRLADDEATLGNDTLRKVMDIVYEELAEGNALFVKSG